MLEKMYEEKEAAPDSLKNDIPVTKVRSDIEATLNPLEAAEREWLNGFRDYVPDDVKNHPHIYFGHTGVDTMNKYAYGMRGPNKQLLQKACNGGEFIDLGSNGCDALMSIFRDNPQSISRYIGVDFAQNTDKTKALSEDVTLEYTLSLYARYDPQDMYQITGTKEDGSTYSYPKIREGAQEKVIAPVIMVHDELLEYIGKLAGPLPGRKGRVFHSSGMDSGDSDDAGRDWEGHVKKREKYTQLLGRELQRVTKSGDIFFTLDGLTVIHPDEYGFKKIYGPESGLGTRVWVRE